MAPAKKIEEASIIEVIRKMVADGENEEKIVQTLRDLGIEPDKAKRLVLLGQADTFALLKSEISKIVASEIEKQKPVLEKAIAEETKKISKGTKDELTSSIIVDLKKYEKDITGQSKTFQEQIGETVSKMAELSERVKTKLNEQGDAIKQIQLDMDETKLLGISKRNKLVSLILIIFGSGFCIGGFYLLVSTFSGEITVDNIIFLVTMVLMGITMLFVSTMI